VSNVDDSLVHYAGVASDLLVIFGHLQFLIADDNTQGWKSLGTFDAPRSLISGKRRKEMHTGWNARRLEKRHGGMKWRRKVGKVWVRTPKTEWQPKKKRNPHTHTHKL